MVGCENLWKIYVLWSDFHLSLNSGKICWHCIDVTWASWCIKPPVTPLFVQRLTLTAQEHKKRALLHLPATAGFPSQRDSDAEINLMSCHHYVQYAVYEIHVLILLPFETAPRKWRLNCTHQVWDDANDLCITVSWVLLKICVVIVVVVFQTQVLTIKYALS